MTPHTNEGAAGTSAWGSAGHAYLHPRRVKGIFRDLSAKEWGGHTGMDFVSLG